MTVTTSGLTHRLYRQFETSEDAITAKYIVATQVRPLGSHGESTADAVVVGNWPSAGYEVQGFEIKVSRSDWLNEVKSPNKNDLTKQYCDRWWLVIADEIMVKDGELPDDWGMMVPHKNKLKVVKAAPKLNPIPTDGRFITGLMRANKRDHISEDLHKQYLQDQRRTLEAALKAEYADLREFVKVIKQAFGIELKQDKQWRNGNMENVWVAKVRSKWSTYTPEQLKALLEAAITGDLEQVGKDLAKARKDAEGVIEMLEPYKGKSLW